MRILQVNKFLYPRAGAETYVLGLARLLMEHGNEVKMWGCHAPIRHSERPQGVEESHTLPYEQGEISRLRSSSSARDDMVVANDLLVDQLNFDRRDGAWRDIKKFGHMIWSLMAARKFELVLKQFRPDLIHIHNIYHHLSPSILNVAAKRGIPVVMSVHDYHLINPNYTLYDHGAICERAGLAAITHRCIQNSFVASAADVVEQAVHRWLGVYEKNIARYLVPTEFVKEKLAAGGIDRKKIEVVQLPIGISPPPQSSPLKGEEAKGNSPPLVGVARGGGMGYILYAGRLVPEKGIYFVLEIAKQLPGIQFKIAGTGPEASGVRDQVLGLRKVELLGFVAKEKLQTLIAGARMIIVPSLWHEPSPYAVLEAMASGKVVVASKIGGIPELIEDGKTGFLAESGNVLPWVDIIAKVCYDEALLKKVGHAARKYVQNVHDLENHYEKIMEIYRTARY